MLYGPDLGLLTLSLLFQDFQYISTPVDRSECMHIYTKHVTFQHALQFKVPHATIFRW